MTRRIYIRADGSKEIGMGHLYRASILAEFFRKSDFETILITQKNDSAQLFLDAHKLKSVTIETSHSVADEIIQLSHLSQYLEKPDLFILDILQYDNDPEYLKVVRKFNAPIVAITDDSFRRNINSDLIINGNPNQLNIDYGNERQKYLLGPKYFIMDNEYADLIIKPPGKKVNTVLVSVGGSDHNNILFRILHALDSVEGISALVVTSKSTGYLSELETFLTTLRMQTQLEVDLPGLKSVWTQCDVAITAGGNTLFERIASRVPGVTVCQLTRQNEIASKFEELGVNINLGMAVSLSEEALKQRLNDFILDISNHIKQYNLSRLYLDGRGLERIASSINTLIKEKINL